VTEWEEHVLAWSGVREEDKLPVYLGGANTNECLRLYGMQYAPSYVVAGINTWINASPPSSPMP
jgi:hypothetical protein